MLPKKNRLPAYLIPEILKKGKRFYSELFVLFISRQTLTANNQTRFAFIIPKKAIKKAVKRNQTKRSLYHIIKINLEKIRLNYNVIFLVKKKIMLQTFVSIKDETEKVLKKINLTEEKK